MLTTLKIMLNLKKKSCYDLKKYVFIDGMTRIPSLVKVISTRSVSLIIRPHNDLAFTNLCIYYHNIDQDILNLFK